MDFLSESQNFLGVAQMVAAFITAIATFALWRVTRVLAIETTTLAAMTSRPFVVCMLESSEADSRALNLVFRNTGNATAFDVVAEITPGLRRDEDAEEKTKWEISILPPGQAASSQGVMAYDVYQVEYQATISWAAFPSSLDKDQVSYSFKAADGFRGGWSSKCMHQLVEEVEKIRKELGKR